MEEEGRGCAGRPGVSCRPPLSAQPAHTLQVFFHRYFTKKKEREDEKAAKVGKRRGREDESDESDESDGDEGASDDGELSASDVEPSADVEDDVEGPDSDVDEAEIWEACHIFFSFSLRIELTSPIRP